MTSLRGRGSFLVENLGNTCLGLSQYTKYSMASFKHFSSSIQLFSLQAPVFPVTVTGLGKFVAHANKTLQHSIARQSPEKESLHNLNNPEYST